MKNILLAIPLFASLSACGGFQQSYSVEWEMPEEVLTDYRVSAPTSNANSNLRVGSKVKLPDGYPSRYGKLTKNYTAATGENCWMVYVNSEISVPMCKSNDEYKFSTQIISGTI